MNARVVGDAQSHMYPRFHVRTPTGFVNDPNGPILIDGTLHLFFQSRMSVEFTEPVKWGHATSRDLARWTVLNSAIHPTQGTPDVNGCWSGNTVMTNDGRLRAFYSGYRHEYPYQSVLTAESSDEGATFGDPIQVIPDPEPASDVIHFRDPFVWREADGWGMLVGSGSTGDRGSVRLYRSPDLDEWTFAGELTSFTRAPEAGIDTGGMWECPQLVEVDGRETLVFGAWAEPEGTMAVYAIPAHLSPRNSTEFQRIDDGPDFYAPSVLRSSPDGPLMFGWIRESKGSTLSDDSGWSGMLALPRVIEAGPNGELRLFPIPTISILRQGEGYRLTPDAPIDVTAQFEVALHLTSDSEVSLRLSFGDSESLQVSADRAAGTVRVDRSEWHLDPLAEHDSCLITEAFDSLSHDIDLRIFVDGSVIEIFSSAGKVATLRFYSMHEPPWHLTFTRGRASAHVWELDPKNAVTQTGEEQSHELMKEGGLS